jgi:hypothetical protein
MNRPITKSVFPFKIERTQRERERRGEEEREGEERRRLEDASVLSE